MNSKKTELNKLKEQAELNALKRLHLLINSPDDLHQIDSHLIKSEKIKDSAEIQLKNAIQSHYFCVSTCMDQLRVVNNSMNEIEKTIYEIQEDYKKTYHLETSLSELRREAIKHKQLKAANENLNNVLNINDLVSDAVSYIQENKLLNAHKCLIDMENCCNAIQEEIGVPNDRLNNISEIKLVEEHFNKIKEVQDLLQNHLFSNIKQMLNISESFPEQLVSSLRIIEREEILDQYWNEKREKTGFMPSDRPKKWRNECFNTIRKIYEAKLYGCRIEQKGTSASWLSKHLGNMCTIFLNDLEITKKFCEPCFPASYKIFAFSVSCINELIGNYLKSLIDENDLGEKEMFVLLSWLDTYKSDYFMGSPKLKLNVSMLPELLDGTYYQKALNSYVENASNTMTKWFQNAMDKHFNEWISEDPKMFDEYESNMPIDINSMLIQQLDLISYANDDRFAKETLKLINNKLNIFVENLKSKTIEFSNDHFGKTNAHKSIFVTRMATNANDCVRLKENFFSIRNRYDKYMDKDELNGPNDQYVILGRKIMQISYYCLDNIVVEMTKSLDEHNFKLLLSKEWLTNDQIINNILVTSDDYIAKDINLKDESRIVFLAKWHNRIKAEYLKGFFQNHSKIFKFQLKEEAERELFTFKLNKEIVMLEKWFRKIGSKVNTDFKTLDLMNKVIEADSGFVNLEVAILTKHCPMTSDMLSTLLFFRGDISKSDFKEKFESYSCDESKIKDESLLIVKRELKMS